MLELRSDGSRPTLRWSIFWNSTVVHANLMHKICNAHPRMKCDMHILSGLTIDFFKFVEACKAIHGPAINDTDIQEALSDFLKHAPARQGGYLYEVYFDL